MDTMQCCLTGQRILPTSAEPWFVEKSVSTFLRNLKRHGMVLPRNMDQMRQQQAQFDVNYQLTHSDNHWHFGMNTKPISEVKGSAALKLQIGKRRPDPHFNQWRLDQKGGDNMRIMLKGRSHHANAHVFRVNNNTIYNTLSGAPRGEAERK